MTTPSKPPIIPPGLKIEEPKRSFWSCYSSSSIEDSRLVPEEAGRSRSFFSTRSPPSIFSEEEQNSRSHQLVAKHIIQNSENPHASEAVEAFFQEKTSQNLTLSLKDTPGLITHLQSVNPISKKIVEQLLTNPTQQTVNEIFLEYTQNFYKANPTYPKPSLSFPLKIKDLHEAEEFVKMFSPPPSSPSSRNSSTQHRFPPKLRHPSSISQPFYSSVEYPTDSEFSQNFPKKYRGSSSCQSQTTTAPMLLKESNPKSSLSTQKKFLYYRDAFSKIKNPDNPHQPEQADYIWTHPSPPNSFSSSKNETSSCSKEPFDSEKILKTLKRVCGGSPRQHNEVAESIENTAREFEPLKTSQLVRVMAYHTVERKLPPLTLDRIEEPLTESPENKNT